MAPTNGREGQRQMMSVVEAVVEQPRVYVDPLGRVTRKEAAKALGKEAKTLQHWAAKGKGPRAFDVGGRIYYSWSEVCEFGGLGA